MIHFKDGDIVRLVRKRHKPLKTKTTYTVTGVIITENIHLILIDNTFYDSSDFRKLNSSIFKTQLIRFLLN